MQTICKITSGSKKESWSTPLPLNLLNEWRQIATQLSKLKNIPIPCFCFSEFPQNIELHGFYDASERAFGAAIYIRGIIPVSAPMVQLVISKSRVAPLKKANIASFGTMWLG